MAGLRRIERRSRRGGFHNQQQSHPQARFQRSLNILKKLVWLDYVITVSKPIHASLAAFAYSEFIPKVRTKLKPVLGSSILSLS